MAETPYPPETLTTKPGWQTTEFYVTLLTACMPILTAVFNRDFSSQIQPWAAVAASIATAAYAFSRAQGKRDVMQARSNVEMAAIAGATPTVAPVVSASPQTGPETAPSAIAPSPMAVVPLDILISIQAQLDQLAAAQTKQTKVKH